MKRWEYHKIDLNQLPRKGDVLDLLDEAGEQGWELVVILPNNLAHFKRVAEQRAAEKQTDPSFSPHAEDVKYRDPKTNQIWSGRGRMPNWLKQKQEAGENIDEYLV
jgi:H-NS histone C-terminal domain